MISVEYDDVKPKILNSEAPNGGMAMRNKRKLIANIGAMSPQQPPTGQQQLISYVSQLQQAQIAQMSPNHIPTIVVEDRSRTALQQPQQLQLQQTQTPIQQQTHQNQNDQSLDDQKNSTDLDDMTPTKQMKLGSSGHTADSFEVFGMFVANEMRSLSSTNLKKKLKRKILQVILEINSLDSENENSG